MGGFVVRLTAGQRRPALPTIPRPRAAQSPWAMAESLWAMAESRLSLMQQEVLRCSGAQVPLQAASPSRHCLVLLKQKEFLNRAHDPASCMLVTLGEGSSPGDSNLVFQLTKRSRKFSWNSI